MMHNWFNDHIHYSQIAQTTTLCFRRRRRHCMIISSITRGELFPYSSIFYKKELYSCFAASSGGGGLLLNGQRNSSYWTEIGYAFLTNSIVARPHLVVIWFLCKSSVVISYKSSLYTLIYSETRMCYKTESISLDEMQVLNSSQIKFA